MMGLIGNQEAALCAVASRNKGKFVEVLFAELYYLYSAYGVTRIMHITYMFLKFLKFLFL